MDDSSMSALLFAKKLRARQTELRARQAVASKAYAGLFEKWKKDLAVFLSKKAPAVCKTITREMVCSTDYHRGTYWRDAIFKDAPKPPKRPNNPVIGKIATHLRRLAITGQKFVTVTTREVDELFSDEDDSEDDDG
jgi:hypothetical protein